MIGLEQRKVSIVAYDAKWPALFLKEKRELSELFAKTGMNVRIEHIGSTSVKGAMAKPIIDIAIGVPTVADVGVVLSTLIASGRDYVKAANQPGMLFLAKGAPIRLIHYHLVVTGSIAWKKVILFRDYLRRHTNITKEYSVLKAELAKRYPDSRLDYAVAKRPYLCAVMTRALWESDNRTVAHYRLRDYRLLRPAVSLRNTPGDVKLPW